MQLPGPDALIMNKLSKEKRLQLVFVAIVTVGVIGGLWFGVIGLQLDKIKAIARSKQKIQDDFTKIQKVAVEAGDVNISLTAATNQLTQIEGAMPSGDLFSYIVSSLKQFNAPSYKVDMPQIGSPNVGSVRQFPNFPYNQAIVAVSGSAYYYEFGKFLADLENHFPYLRVQNLNLEPGFGTTAEEHEKLNFHMEIVNLVKNGNSQP
jgi:hypothetical protein